MSHDEGSELDWELAAGVPEDQQVRVSILDALKWENRVDLSGIDVRVMGGKVSLVGQVRTTEEKELVESVVWGVHGVTSVQNRLQVVRAA